MIRVESREFSDYCVFTAVCNVFKELEYARIR